MDLSKSYEFFQPEKDQARIHIVGCGSVGSTVAENLARCGVTKKVNIRGVPDAVETVEAAVDAAVLLFIRVLHSLLRII